jgi:hypothetical protein
MFFQGYNVDSLIWSTLEVNLGVICACVAGLKPLLTHFFSVVLGKSSSAGNNDTNIYPYISSKGPNFANGSSVRASKRGLQNDEFGKNGGESQRMRTYCQKIEVRQDLAIVNNRRGMDGSSSQESIIRVVESFPQDDEERETETSVTETVHTHQADQV